MLPWGSRLERGINSLARQQAWRCECLYSPARRLLSPSGMLLYRRPRAAAALCAAMPLRRYTAPQHCCAPLSRCRSRASRCRARATGATHSGALRTRRRLFRSCAAARRAVPLHMPQRLQVRGTPAAARIRCGCRADAGGLSSKQRMLARFLLKSRRVARAVKRRAAGKHGQAGGGAGAA